MDKRLFSSHSSYFTSRSGGAMGRRVRSMDWAHTPLGSIEHWPACLQLAAGLCLESALPAALYWGSDFNLLYNDAYASILGAKHPWALGRPARDAWPEIRDFLEPRLRQVAERGEAFFHQDQVLCLRRHGYLEERHFDIALSPARGPEGKVDGVFSTVIETTGRVVAERRAQCLHALAEALAPAESSEAICRLAAEVLARAAADLPFVILYRLDEDGRQARLAATTGFAADSPACPRVVRLDAAEAAPWPLAETVRTGEVQWVADAGRRAGTLPGGAWPEPARQALVLPCAAGTAAGTLLVAGISPRRAIDDDYQGFLQHVARTIGTAVINVAACRQERVRSEAERAELLRAGEERLRYLTDAAGVGCWDWDVVADRGDCTERCRAIFAIPPDKPLSYACFLNTIHPEDRERTDAAMQRALADSGDYDVEYRVVWPDRSEHWVQSKGRVDFGADKQPQRMVGIVVDITARKAAEAAVEARKARLEEEVAARTAELVAANKELQAFAYGVAHDLKSPLRGVISYSQLLALEYGQQLAGAGAEFLDQIQKSVARMRALIDDLLAYSRIEQGSQHIRPVDLPTAIRQVLSEREEDIRRAGVELHLGMPSVKVRGDPEGLAQVLRNLVDNALKFSARARPPVIEIGGEAAGDRCRLWVRDNGVGFDMAQHDRIFEIFQRLHRADDIPGTGIGLALVKKAMERIGGRVWAESAPGQGASFFIELPVQES